VPRLANPDWQMIPSDKLLRLVNSGMNAFASRAEDQHRKVHDKCVNQNFMGYAGEF